MLPDTVFNGIPEAYSRVLSSHGFVSSIDLREHPTVILTLTYQDGLMHALSRILARRSTGEYSNIHNVHKRLHSYEILRRQYVRRRDSQDIAYVDGYLNGVYFLLADHPARRVLPLLYVFGADQQPFTKD